MAYLLKKRGKFFEGHSYASGFGYNFFWTRNEDEARRFQDDDANSDFFKKMTGARIVHVENTKEEAKALRRRAKQLAA